ncbi:hypothetical protein SBA4_5520005 [Candidatus Sulfopaludibacter sp. SbA4]|nr:hypothetical protein SBA4_5520005 [Candidatus Sulfopaludibacter sp. SbA4]
MVLCLQAFAAGNVAGLWHFDENAGLVAHDSSGYDNDGQLINSPLWTAGKFGSALHFNGTSALVEVTSSPSLSITGSITLEAWVKLDSSSATEPIVAKWNDISVNNRSYYLGIDDGLVRFDISHSGLYGGSTCTVNNASGFACIESARVFSTTAIPLGKWAHVAGVFDSSSKTLEVFIDGVLSNSAIAEKSNIFKVGEPVLIGAADFGGATRQFFPGAIDEARVWKRALSPAEVLSSAQAGLRGLWHFNTSANNYSPDSSGYGDDAFLGGGGTITTSAKFGAGALSVNGTYAATAGDGALNIGGPITVEAWVNLKAFPSLMSNGHQVGFAPIAGKWADIGHNNNQRSHALAVMPDGSVRFDVSHNGQFAPTCAPTDNAADFKCASAVNAVVISSHKITLSTWYHIAGVFDGTTLQVFVSGVADTSIGTVGKNIFLNAPLPVAFGMADEGGIQRQFTDGSIDEVQVWARPLSAAEIAFQANPANAAELLLASEIDQELDGGDSDHGDGHGDGHDQAHAKAHDDHESDGGGAIFESDFQAGATNPVMVLEFVIPDTAGTKITSIFGHPGQDNGGSHLAGWVTGNSALDALITANGVKSKSLGVDVNLSDNTSLEVQIEWADQGDHGEGH